MQIIGSYSNHHSAKSVIKSYGYRIDNIFIWSSIILLSIEADILFPPNLYLLSQLTIQNNKPQPRVRQLGQCNSNYHRIM